MVTNKDLEQIQSKGLSLTDIENQKQNFKNGFPYLNIERPAKVGDGLIKLNSKEVEAFIQLFDDRQADTLKFVPASGAASRMFKFLFAFYEDVKEQYQSLDEIENIDVKKFFEKIQQFAFYDELKLTISVNNLSIDDLLSKGQYRKILKYFLFESGLNYGQKPKGVLLFHKYKNIVKTAFEEHLVEGAKYAILNNKVKIHFTISPEHYEMFYKLFKKLRKDLETQYQVEFEISFSQQKSSTDIIAVDLNNELFRNTDGSLLLRPGGHGALIENLNDLDADIIFIKNIDNIVPDKIKDITVQYKKALAGVLLSYKERIFTYLERIDSKDYDKDLLNEIKDFITEELCVEFKLDNNLSLDQYAEILAEKLNRPIRVCGMVENEGEPGGGPFWVKHSDGTVDLQIVESSQINQSDKEQLHILKSSTHFNPVDLICSTKDYKGEKFDLLKYRDSNTGFISKKSKDGEELKAQELPGLWNGAMANWNTIFVEVPILTFNPVKTVNDLLRPEHQ